MLFEKIKKYSDVKLNEVDVDVRTMWFTVISAYRAFKIKNISRKIVGAQWESPRAIFNVIVLLCWVTQIMY